MDNIEYQVTSVILKIIIDFCELLWNVILMLPLTNHR